MTNLMLYIKNEIYDLAMYYYNISTKTKNKLDISNYSFIRKIYVDVVHLNQYDFVKYLNSYLENKMLSMQHKKILLQIFNIYKKYYKNDKKIKIYNKELLDQASEYSFLKQKNNILSILNTRVAIMSSPTFDIDINDLAFCILMDNAVVKKMYNNEHLDNLDILYLKEIDREMSINPKLIFCLPLSNLSYEKLISYKKYMPNIESILSNAKEIFKKAKSINDRLTIGHTSTLELNYLYTFLGYYLNYNRVSESNFNNEFLVKKLMNKSAITYHELIFMMKYIGYSKCVEEGLTGVEILFTDCDKFKNSENQHVLGGQNKGFVLLNKKHMIGTSFIEKYYKKIKSITSGMVYSGPVVIETLYHEIRHAVQNRDYIEHKDNYEDYIHSLDSIISKYGNKNYYHCLSEKDANIYAYKNLTKFLQKYLPVNSEINKSNKSKENYEILMDFDYKITDGNKEQITGIFEKRATDNYFKNNPEKLKDFPIFRKLYDSNGKPYEFSILLSNALFEGKEYYYTHIVGKLYDGETLTKNNFQKRTNKEKLNIVKNIYTFVKYINVRLAKSLKMIYKYNLEERKKLIDYNILVDIKAGQILINWYLNVFEHFPDLINYIYKDNNKLLKKINSEIELFKFNKKNLFEKIQLDDIERKI